MENGIQTDEIWKGALEEQFQSSRQIHFFAEGNHKLQVA